MKNVLLAGASGHLGKEVLRELKRQSYFVRALVRNPQKAAELQGLANEVIVAGATNPKALAGACAGMEGVISALGKSVSPQDRSKNTFREVGYLGNLHLLEEAKQAQIKRFVYNSAYNAQKYPHLEYFRVHEDFVRELRQSGISSCLLRPPALFSALAEILEMARKGRAVVLGKGDKMTNPIADADLAHMVVTAMETKQTEVEAGGKVVYSRRQLVELALQATGWPRQRILRVPFGAIKMMLPLVLLFDKNLFDKAAFLTAVCEEDCLAPLVGNQTLEAFYQEQMEQAEKAPAAAELHP